MPISHILIKATAAEYPTVVTFYDQVLKTIGLQKLPGFPEGMTAFGVNGPELVVAIGPVNTQVHVAFNAPNETAVNAFHTEAISAGAKDNGAPGRRAHIHPNYHAAFVLDPIGNNIEAACIVA
ncbi:hypothetical protein PT974_10390 [Cladobotryum mycophilum]|uniref:VOC domain-containing protein n=1 Tax=Cladobotryum mycophilum TaxID=491253 RepID=A0ABR0S9Q2_9HYPO